MLMELEAQMQMDEALDEPEVEEPPAPLPDPVPDPEPQIPAQVIGYRHKNPPEGQTVFTVPATVGELSSDNMWVTGQDANQLWKSMASAEPKAINTRFMMQRSVGVISNSGSSTPHVGGRLENCEFVGNGETYWGTRLYDQGQLLVKNCMFTNIGHFKETNYEGKVLGEGGKREGHCIYVNLYGSMKVEDCSMVSNLGQGIQVVWRDEETNIPGDPMGLLQIHRTLAQDCGMWGDRASFPISIFNPGQEVDIRDVKIRTTDVTPEWRKNQSDTTLYRSRGGLLVGIEGKNPRRTPILHARHLSIELMMSDRAGVKLEDIDDIDWRYGFVSDSEKEITIDINQGCPKGSIRDLEGNFAIRRQGDDGKFHEVAKDDSYEWGIHTR
jgi:hypothetical protein